MAESPYDILGVEHTASAAEIKKAYRRLARKHHPDVNPGDAAAEAQFKKISEAYAVVSDPVKRAQYDRGGQVGAGTAGDTAGVHFGGFDFTQAGPGSFADLFADLFAGARAQEPVGQRPGDDLHASVPLSFEE